METARRRCSPKHTALRARGRRPSSSRDLLFFYPSRTDLPPIPSFADAAGTLRWRQPVGIGIGIPCRLPQPVSRVQRILRGAMVARLGDDARGNRTDGPNEGAKGGFSRTRGAAEAKVTRHRLRLTT